MCPQKTISSAGFKKGPLLALVFLTLIWGYNWVVMKEGLRFCGPFVFAALRTVPSSLFLFVLLLWKRKDPRPWNAKLMILLGILSTTAGLGLPMWALVSGSAGKTAILLYTMPFWALILAWPILGERIHGLEWPAIFTAFAGLVLILKIGAVSDDLFSSLLAVLAGIAWAGSAVVTRILRRRPGFDLLSLTAWQMIFGTPILVAVAFLVPAPQTQWTPFFVGALLYNIFFTSVIAFLLWFYILDNLSAGVATMSTLATPVVSIISAAVQLGEIPSPKEALGMLLILAGIGLLCYMTLRRNSNNQD